MLHLDLASAFLLYLTLTLTALLVISLRTRWHKGSQHWSTPEAGVCKCEFCHGTYIGQKGTKVTQCPQCGSFNKRV